MKFENVVNQTFSSKNGIVENNILYGFKGVLLRLKHSRKNGEVKYLNTSPSQNFSVFASNIELINY